MTFFPCMIVPATVLLQVLCFSWVLSTPPRTAAPCADCRRLSSQVRVFYTAPTLIRSLMQSGDDWVKAHDRSSLRVLGTVGEPIGEHAWNWFGACTLPSCPVLPLQVAQTPALA